MNEYIYIYICDAYLHQIFKSLTEYPSCPIYLLLTHLIKSLLINKTAQFYSLSWTLWLYWMLYRIIATPHVKMFAKQFCSSLSISISSYCQGIQFPNVVYTHVSVMLYMYQYYTWCTPNIAKRVCLFIVCIPSDAYG